MPPVLHQDLRAVKGLHVLCQMTPDHPGFVAVPICTWLPNLGIFCSGARVIIQAHGFDPILEAEGTLQEHEDISMVGGSPWDYCGGGTQGPVL